MAPDPRIAEMMQDIGELRGIIDTHIKGMDNRLSDFNTRIETHFISSNSRLEAMTKRIDKLESLPRNGRRRDITISGGSAGIAVILITILQKMLGLSGGG